MRLKQKILFYGLIGLILAAQFGLLFFEARQESATTDENVHLPAGYTYLKFHDFRFNPEHPPLQKMWVALPLLFQSVRLPADFSTLWQEAGNFQLDSWAAARKFGEELLYSSQNDADRLLLSGRSMTIIWTLMLSLAVYYWSRQRWGRRGGLISLTLTAFSPLILAHGKLANTDIGVTLFFVLSCWALIRFLEKPSWKTSLTMVFFLALLELTKYTGVIFLAAALTIFIYWLYQKKSTWRCELVQLIPWVIFIFSLTWVLITLTYFPQIKFFYAPDYLKGLKLVLGHVASGHSSFLIGQFSRTGWWYYFPLAFVFKTSLVVLILILAMVVLGARKKLNFAFEDKAILLAILVYLLAAMTSKADLGARHLLPIYPLIFILLAWWGKEETWFARQFKQRNFFIALGLVIFVWGSVRAFPYHLAYFNSLIGSQNGYRFLLDSNYDWGQGLKRIAAYQKNQLHGKQIYLDYWWDGDQAPAYYGIDYIRMLPEMQDISGLVVIGATSYMQPSYAWLRQYPISDRIGKSVFVIRLN